MLFASIAAVSALAGEVKVTMNNTSPTMTLVDKNTNNAVEVGEPVNKVYTFQANAGTYVLTAYATDGTTVNGTIELKVTGEAEQAFSIVTVTAYATNSGWVLGTDYTISVYVTTKSGGYEVITPGASTTEGRMTFLMLMGDTYYCDFVPSAAHEGFAIGHKMATMSAATGNASMAVPAGVPYSVSVPADAEFFMGRKTSHYAPFVEEPAISVETSGDTKTYSFNLANSQVYNFRTWKANGLVNAGYFTASTAASKMPELAFTDADYATSPKTIKRDNLAQTGDILLNVNEKGFLQMTTGQTYDLTGLRSWQATDTQTSNYYQEPSFHFTVVNEQGQPDNSVVTFDTYDTTVSPWTTLQAVGSGTAIVLVTYDAINLNYWSTSGAKSDYMYGPFFGAIWPENTGVFVVTVDGTASAAVPNMTINTAMDNSTKNAGLNVDAELDVFYFASSEVGASYTFQPEGVSAVSIAYPTIGEQAVSYNGFTAVAANADGSYTLTLKQGRNIVKMTDTAGNATYQVLTAKAVDYEVQNLTTGDNTIFAPGDKVSVKFETLYHPANKMAGVYNMSANICYENDMFQGASNQYAFASTEAAQTITFNVPMSAAESIYTLSDGNIKSSGFGDPYGNHRLFNKTTGRNANFTAVQCTAYFGQLPEIELPMQVENIIATVTTNATEPIITITRTDGSEVAPNLDGTYTLNYYGTYNYKATAEGYGTAYGSFAVSESNTFALDIIIPAIDATTWDGTTTSEPSLVDEVYQINSGQELAWFAENVNNGTAAAAKAVLTQDIDLAGFNWTAIGNSTNKFTGNFDGQGFTVKNLYIDANAGNFRGLFGNTSAAAIKNVTVDGYINCEGNVARVGGIVGQAEGGSIENCVNKAIITAYQYVGGIVGYGTGALAISRCGNVGSVTGTLLSSTNNWGMVTVGSTYVGGIIGYNNSATASITDSYNQGNLSGANYVGGITGYMQAQVTITNIYNTGDITSTATYTGAIRPQTSATASSANVSNAYATMAYFNDVNTTIVSKAQMASGEVAYKLGNAWGQIIGMDALPVLDGLKVYEYEGGYYNDSPAWNDVVNFEDVDLAIGEAYDGSDDAAMFQSGDFVFLNYYDNTYYSWNGFAASRTTSNEFSSYEDQFNSCTGGGMESTTFAVGYYSEYNYWMDEQAPTIMKADASTFEPAYVYITNTANAVKSMMYGDDYAKQFTEEDWFKLIIMGYDEDYDETGVVEFYLAKDGNIVTDWQKVDLTPLGTCWMIEFTMDSSDKSYGFMNTPAYFCLDNMKIREIIETNYDLAVLTFEDEDYKASANYIGESNWSSLIDDPQYGGPLLYGDGGYGIYDEEDAYTWYDANNTFLKSTINYDWGSWCYWSGGCAVSNYFTEVTAGDYNTQLGIPYTAANGKHGHEGSNNFAVCFGNDGSDNEYGTDARPILTFGDGQSRVIDHAYITGTSYFINSILNGSSFSTAATENTWVNIIAQGYNENEELVGTVTIPYVVNGVPLTEWTKVDLSALGEIHMLKFDFEVSDDQQGAYGINCPCYFAIDDIAVRMPVNVLLADKTEYTNQDYKAVAQLTYTRTFGNTNWQPLYVPFTSDYSDWSDGVIIAKAVNAGSDFISIEELADGDKVTANTPFFIKARATGDVSIVVSDATLMPAESKSITVGGMKLTGIYSAMTITPDTYSVLHEGSIVKTSNAAGYTLPAMRWYVETGASEVKVYLLGDENPDAISLTPAHPEGEGAIYNVAGQRLSKMQKGINIVNSKKVLR